MTTKLNCRAQVSMEIIFSVALLLLIAGFSLIYYGDRTTTTKDTSTVWKAQNYCDLLSSSIDKAFNAGNGFQIQIDFNENAQFYASKKLITVGSDQNYFCKFKAIIANDINANEKVLIENREGKIYITQK